MRFLHSAGERDVPRPHTRIGTGAQQLAVLLVALQPDDAVHPAGARVSDRDVRQRAGDAPDVDVRVQRPGREVLSVSGPSDRVYAARVERPSRLDFLCEMMVRVRRARGREFGLPCVLWRRKG